MANSSLPLNCNDPPVFSKSLPQINAQYHWTEKMAFSFVIAVDFFDFGDKKTADCTHTARVNGQFFGVQFLCSA